MILACKMYLLPTSFKQKHYDINDILLNKSYSLNWLHIISNHKNISN